MMQERKQTEIHPQPDRSVEPEVVERVVFVPDRRPRFVLGLIIGAALLAASVWFFSQPTATESQQAAPAISAPR